MKTLINNKTASLILTTSAFVLVSFLFSNCGDVQFGATAAKPTSNTLGVGPSGGNSAQGTPGTGGTGDGGGTTGTGGNTGGAGGTGGTTTGCTTCGGDGTNIPDLPPTPSHTCSHGGAHDDDSGEHDCEHHKECGYKHKSENDWDDVDTDNDDQGDNEHHMRNCHSGCGNNGVKDVIVNIVRIEIRGTHGEVLTITTDLGPTSIIGGTLPLFVAQDIDIVSIRFILADSGNTLIDNDNKSFNLFVPSGTETGLKVPLADDSMHVTKGAYQLSFKLDLKSFTKRNGKKCMLKPVMKFVSLKPV